MESVAANYSSFSEIRYFMECEVPCRWLVEGYTAREQLGRGTFNRVAGDARDGSCQNAHRSTPMKKNTVWIALIALFTLLLALPAMAVDFSLAGKPGNHGKGGGGQGGGGNGGGGNGGGGNGGGNCGTCAGVITEMTLRYNGTITGAQIMVIQKERSQNHVLFEGTVQ